GSGFGTRAFSASFGFGRSTMLANTPQNTRGPNLPGIGCSTGLRALSTCYFASLSPDLCCFGEKLIAQSRRLPRVYSSSQPPRFFRVSIFGRITSFFGCRRELFWAAWWWLQPAVFFSNASVLCWRRFPP